ncbi:MAG: trypsin-like serine protease [Polyangiaceae bacterium]
MSGLGFPLRVLAIVGGHEAPSPVVAAVAQVGRCSATLVGPTVILTSAHCLDGPIDRVMMDRKDVAVTSCERHPAYQPGQAAHDIGYCRLATRVAGALPIDTAFELSPGESVSLAGFGASGPRAREKPTLRMVSTSIVRADEDHLEIGTTTATACRGDSGGPVLVERGGAFGVTGIIEGAQGVICGSPARAVPLHPQMDWLRAVLAADPDGRAKHGVLALALVVLAGACVLAVRRRRSATRAE